MTNKINHNCWTRLYNETHPFDRIVSEVFSNGMSSTYILQSRKDLRMFADDKTFHFLKEKLMSVNFENVAKITDCFTMGMPSEDGDEHMHCIISEPLNRDIIGHEKTQSGIKLFRDIWREYLHCMEWHVDNYIIDAYTKNDTIGMDFVLKGIKASQITQEEKNVAIALNGAYKDVMSLGNAMIWPLSINVGLSDDAIVKITHIGIR